MKKDMDEGQKRVYEFMKEYTLSDILSVCILDLSSKVGDLYKEYNKIIDCGKRPFIPNKGFEEAIGNVLFSLLVVAEVSGIDLIDALDEMLLEMKDRLIKMGIIVQGGNK